MGLTMRRSRHLEPPVTETTSEERPWAVPVGVASALEHLAAPIAEALGPGFRVTLGSMPDHGIAVIAAHGRSAMAFLRAGHPATLFLVDCHGARHHTDGAAAYLNAGADGCIDTASPVEIAAHVRALSRRMAL